MEWILVVCTSGWILCSNYFESAYPDETACYRAMDELYKKQGREAFKYVICKPKKRGDGK